MFENGKGYKQTSVSFFEFLFSFLGGGGRLGGGEGVECEKLLVWL